MFIKLWGTACIKLMKIFNYLILHYYCKLVYIFEIEPIQKCKMKSILRIAESIGYFRGGIAATK